MTLIRDLIDIPERVQKGDYVLKLVEDDDWMPRHHPLRHVLGGKEPTGGLARAIVVGRVHVERHEAAAGPKTRPPAPA